MRTQLELASFEKNKSVLDIFAQKCIMQQTVQIVSQDFATALAQI